MIDVIVLTHDWSPLQELVWTYIAEMQGRISHDYADFLRMLPSWLRETLIYRELGH